MTACRRDRGGRHALGRTWRPRDLQPRFARSGHTTTRGHRVQSRRERGDRFRPGRWRNPQLLGLDHAQRVAPTLHRPSGHVRLHEPFGRPLHDEGRDQGIPAGRLHGAIGQPFTKATSQDFDQQFSQGAGIASGVTQQPVAQNQPRGAIPRAGLLHHELMQRVTHANTRIDERGHVRRSIRQECGA